MKKLVLLFGLLSIIGVSCNQSEKNLSDTTFVSDNSELEEAKAITRKLLEGLKKVEENKMNRESFETFAEPLQKKLNTLILSMGDLDARELEAYKNELLIKMIKKEKDLGNT